MKRVIGDLWSYHNAFVVIPINLEGVCGRGLARQMVDMFPGLGQTLRRDGQRGMLRLSYDGGRALHMYTPEIANPGFTSDQPYYRIVPFPVKVSWRDQGNLPMIIKSTQMLVELLRMMPEPHDCVIPQVGCGYGELRPEDVIPLIEPILDLTGDRVTWLEPDPEIFKKYTKAFEPGFRSDRTAVEANKPRS